MKTNNESKIYNLIILDESGSMQTIRMQALSGANKTLQTIRNAQKENPADNQMVSFVTFSSRTSRPGIRPIIFCEKIDSVKDIEPDQYQPDGGTPLYDAMGFSITKLKEIANENDHVLVTVITDGYENDSRYFNAAMIKELVDNLSKQGWAFTFIGANQDAHMTASGLGIRSAMDFEQSAEGSSMMWDKMNSGNREFYKKVRRSKETGIKCDYNEDFFGEKQAMNRVTPNNISELRSGEIFVFGSNLAGHHDGGAARLALERFGAAYGQGTGLQGSSYAIPTMGLSLEMIAKYVDEFILFADSHPEMKFLVTRIGCGIAGFDVFQIAPLFARAYCLPNVYLPADFWKVLTFRYGR